MIAGDTGARGATRRTLLLGAGALILATIGGCDFDVTNPGPVQDANLDDTGAHQALVTGALRGSLNGLSHYAHYGSSLARDNTTGGHTGAGGIPLELELGQLDDQNTDAQGWNRTHQGRWIAEESIRRMRETLGSEGDAYSPLGRLYLWGGIANRVLGEHVCTAVFDGGGPEPYLAHFTRAVELFTGAEQIAQRTGESEVRYAAIAGRAAAHVYLGNWAEAAADAAEVPFDFTFEVEYTGRGAGDLGTDGERWRITQGMTSSYRGVSFWNTPFETYFPETGDPRVAWGHDPNFEAAPIPRPTWGEFVPFYYPLKFYAPRHLDERTIYAINENDMWLVPVNLMSGREMELIRAEASLATGGAAGIDQAMTHINRVRTSYDSYFTGEPLAPLATPASLEEAWAVLKFERLIELVLEGRRFGDRKRWKENGTPGEIHPLEYIPQQILDRYSIPSEPDLCFPIPRSEKEANDNIALDYVG